MKAKKFIVLISNFFCNRTLRFSYMVKLGLTDCLPDKLFLSMKYRSVFLKKICFDNPIGFNEKLQFLKLYNRRPEYTLMVDKYKVREYITKTIGKQYLVPLLGVWNTSDEIDFEELPNQFVLKCNHNSGLGMCICNDKSKLNIKQVKKELENGMKQNYYLTGREWPYKDVSRKIIAEKFLESDSGGLTDYKIHCFNGVPKFVLVCCDRFAESGLTEDFYTIEWEHMSVKRPDIPNSVIPLPRPEKLDEMIKLAEILSKDIPFIRTDFYCVEGKIYFSELTFFPASGFERFEPEEWDYIFGDFLILPNQ